MFLQWHKAAFFKVQTCTVRGGPLHLSVVEVWSYCGFCYSKIIWRRNVWLKLQEMLIFVSYSMVCRQILDVSFVCQRHISKIVCKKYQLTSLNTFFSWIVTNYCKILHWRFQMTCKNAVGWGGVTLASCLIENIVGEDVLWVWDLNVNLLLHHLFLCSR